MRHLKQQKIRTPYAARVCICIGITSTFQLRNSHHRSVSGFAENCTLVRISSLSAAIRFAGFAAEEDGGYGFGLHLFCQHVTRRSKVRSTQNRAFPWGTSDFSYRSLAPPPQTAPAPLGCGLVWVRGQGNGREFSRSRWRLCRLTDAASPLRGASLSAVKRGAYDGVPDAEYKRMLDAMTFISDLWRYPDSPPEAKTAYETNALSLLANAIGARLTGEPRRGNLEQMKLLFPGFAGGGLFFIRPKNVGSSGPSSAMRGGSSCCGSSLRQSTETQPWGK